jgi:hypothetical protein
VISRCNLEFAGTLLAEIPSPYVLVIYVRSLGHSAAFGAEVVHGLARDQRSK